jgi:hypothetical protein
MSFGHFDVCRFRLPHRVKSIRNPKQALYDQFAAVAKVLGNPQRLELIMQLAQGLRTSHVATYRGR